MRARVVVLSFLLVGLIVLHHGALAAEQKLKLHPGERATIELQENPSTGYKWQIDRAGSSNPTIIRIDDGGFAENGRANGRRLLGAPGSHRWSIEALSTGDARISFMYLRSWERTPIRRHEVIVQIVPR